MSHIRSLFGLLGRICIAAVFIISGFGKITNWSSDLAQMVQVGIVPYTPLLLFFATCIEIIGGLSLLLGWHFRFFAILLALYLIPVTYSFHDFWAINDPAQKLMETIEFLKNLAIFGGLICLVSGPGRYTIDKSD